MPSSRWYKGLNCRVQKHIHYPSLRCLRLRGIGGQCLKLPWDLTTPYTGTCFDYLLRSLLHGGTRGLTAGYKGLHFPKCTTMKNTFFRSKALDLPKLKNTDSNSKMGNWPWGPMFGGCSLWFYILLFWIFSQLQECHNMSASTLAPLCCLPVLWFIRNCWLVDHKCRRLTQVAVVAAQTSQHGSHITPRTL